MRVNNKQAFFILSCARSGSTSLATILNEASNGICDMEPVPNLNSETRDMMEGRISDPMVVLESTVLPRVREMLSNVEVYGEKNVTYGPFIPYLYEALKCKFIFIKRDGRDVVRSLINWHEKKFGTIYRECKEIGNLSSTAISAAAKLPVYLDTSDYARPRPLRGDPLYVEWENMRRLEMCAYYWSTINELYLDKLQELPDDAWIMVDYTSPQPENIVRVIEFCGLKGLNWARIQDMLQQRINSLQERDVQNDNIYPDWKNWDIGKRRSFDKIASKTMYRLGYYKENSCKWKPENYGKWWQNNEGELEWYIWMYNGRLKMHKDLVVWVNKKVHEGDEIMSIADFGCGLGVGYCDDFANKEYIGVDLSEKNIQWCKENRKNHKHRYYCIDFITEPLIEPVDLVFSSGTIDNTYDIDAFFYAMVRNSKKWIFVSAYRGWFPNLSEHIYHYDEKTTCFYNDISPGKVKMQLESLGCTDIDISPLATGNENIPFETRVIAKVPS